MSKQGVVKISRHEALNFAVNQGMSISRRACPHPSMSPSIIWLLHTLVEASFDLFRYPLLGDQLIPGELHPLVSYTSKVNCKAPCLARTEHAQRKGTDTFQSEPLRASSYPAASVPSLVVLGRNLKGEGSVQILPERHQRHGDANVHGP